MAAASTPRSCGVATPLALAMALTLSRAAHAAPEIGLYGDINGGIQTTGSRVGTEDGFSAAKLELFADAAAGRWSFLAETMFEAGDDNSFEIDVERIQISYLHSEWLRL